MQEYAKNIFCRVSGSQNSVYILKMFREIGKCYETYEISLRGSPGEYSLI